MPPEPKTNRACEACRSVKVRCCPDETSYLGICQRCSRSGRNCQFAPPKNRRQRVRTDTRVAELEKEVRNMRSFLKSGILVTESNENQRETSAAESSNKDSDFMTNHSFYSASRPFPLQPAQWQNSYEGIHMGASSITFGEDGHVSDTYIRSTPDVIDRGLLSLEKAEELFNTYVTELVPNYPVVIPRPGVAASEIRSTKPVLFLALIAAAAAKSDTKLYKTLNDELLAVFAHVIVIKSNKSLELVQSMIITAVWYFPPDATESLSFVQWIHMAASMAIDIGLGTKPQGHVRRGMGQGFSEVEVLEELENARSILAVYINCSSVALGLRKPSMLRFSRWMGECVEIIEQSPFATIYDKRLVAWVKLQRILDEWSSDDPSLSLSSDDSRLQVTLKGFEVHLDEWKEELHSDVMNGCLAITYHQNRIYMHELALKRHDHADRFTIFMPQAITEEEHSRPPTISATRINAIATCVKSAHALLDAFLGLDIAEMRTVSVVFYVRATYSIGVLFKVADAIKKAPALAKILETSELKIETYLEALLQKLITASDSTQYRVPTKWLQILEQLKSWYHSYKLQLGSANRTDETGQLLSSQIFSTATNPSCSRSLSCTTWLDNSDRSSNIDSFYCGDLATTATPQEHSSDLAKMTAIAASASIVLCSPESLRDETELRDPVPSASHLSMSGPGLPKDSSSKNELSFIDGPSNVAGDWISDGTMFGDINFNQSNYMSYDFM